MVPNNLILVINPGSTSTKISVYQNRNQVFLENVSHDAEALKDFKKISEQYELRYNEVVNALRKHNIDIKSLTAVIGRGGLIKPVESGVYHINSRMIEDLTKNVFIEHASNLGALIAKKIADSCNIPSYIADPVVVDEMMDLARITGRPEISRISRFHALNHKAVARKAARLLGKEYNEVNLIVAHMGGGISVAAHEKGKVVDVTEALYGDAPFSAERAGKLPTGQLVEMCFEPNANVDDIKRKLVGSGGLVAHCGTNDGRVIEEKINNGDKATELVYTAMAYQISKDIASFGATLKGEVNGIVLTGGMARSEMLVSWISDRVKYMGQVFLFPGENEMESLADAAYRALTGEEKVKEYK
jgi:butyrate kinase